MSGRMDSRVLRWRKQALTQGRPGARVRSVRPRGGSLRLPWGGPLSGPRRDRGAPTEAPIENEPDDSAA